ncbi:MAG: transporter substrate-binding domain-containing protein [Treponema sp.]|nr:transporter substrate-binding domain-containing protein [Treponema sp.]
MPVDGNIVLPLEIESAGSRTLKMGTNAAFPPFEYMEGAKIVGFDASMAQLIARDFGARLDIVDMAFDGLIAALQANSIDFIAAGMTATDERRKSVDFSDAYYSSNQVIIVKN